VSPSTGRDPFQDLGHARHGYVDAGTLTGAPDTLRPVYLPSPDSVGTLLAPPPSSPPLQLPHEAPVAVPHSGDTQAIATVAPTAPPVVPEPRHARPRRRRGVAARGRSTRRGDIALTIAGIGLGICLGIGVYATKDGLDLPGGKMLAVGTLSALVGTYLALMMILLMARIPWIEREVGATTASCCCTARSRRTRSS
jgi:hypothetical protein